ncbi:MAG: efflux RND transporter periplasmic adaptor subunit [Bryobacterales bacterium]
MRVYILLSVALAATLLASGCGGDAPDDAAAGAAVQTVKTAVVAAQARQTPVYVYATGGFVADESSNVAPPAAGRVAQTPVDIGDFVEKGQVVARLDASDLRLRSDQSSANLDQAKAALRQAESRIGLTQGDKFDPSIVPEVQAAEAAYASAQAQARLAEADAKRYENLVATGDVSLSNYQQALTAAETARAQAAAQKQQYQAALNTARQSYQSIESAQAAVRAAEAQLAQANKAMTDTAIVAPFAGYVTARPVAVGEYVSSSATIVTLVRLEPIRLELQIPEVDAAKLETGLTVESNVAAYPDRQFPCTISAINPAVDPQSRAVMVEARCANDERKLRPGMFSNARILLRDEVEGVFVPKTAVFNDPTTESVQAFVVENGTARLRIVQTAEAGGSEIRVLSGIEPGEKVAALNLDQLYDGAPVETVGR